LVFHSSTKVLVVIKLSTAPLHSVGNEMQFLNYVKQILKPCRNAFTDNSEQRRGPLRRTACNGVCN